MMSYDSTFVFINTIILVICFKKIQSAVMYIEYIASVPDNALHRNEYYYLKIIYSQKKMMHKYQIFM
jgi:hypothetical protein